ncbi:PREDICTED: sterol O-acyltransferase 1 [Propithecus coquereli]|uniref:sterol O-acyltransferase 1 n=1 Tax=Propithecus coquereli TaxID=379532 RepID=UPI00063F24B9|nr:PREDICTED: sterol O-acyltransferase 1 [Propithecus coquereli]
MVGEEKMSLRNRLSKSSKNPEEDEDRRNPTVESLQIPSNGRIDIKRLIAKKMQLTAEAEELKPFFMKEVGSHFDDFVTNLIEKSASLDNGGCALTTFSVLEGEKNNHRTKDLRAPPEQGKIFTARRSLLEIFEFKNINIRLIMKAHSFVRENVPRVLNSAKEKSSTVPVPTVNQYLYFLFAPTLIYRDSYPSYLEGLLILLILFLGVLILFLTFFAFLHCWLNAFAEMLRFGDRMFYKDWWNSTSYSNYYRTWNVVVHDWLYYYAYKDFLWLFSKRFKSAAMLAVFAVSAIVHEYALAVCLSFFYPVLFVLFMFFGMAFNFIVNDSRKRPIWNVLMWTSLFLGIGVLLCFYSQEWYARQRCPLKNPTFLDYIQPRSWTCQYVF